MLFVMVSTWEPSAAEEIVRRFTEREVQVPKGIKLIGHYVDLGFGRSFSVFETDDPEVIAKLTLQGRDILNMEIVPVMEFLEIK